MNMYRYSVCAGARASLAAAAEQDVMLSLRALESPPKDWQRPTPPLILSSPRLDEAPPPHWSETL
eukprot:1593988-Alexandrium_andersonii.AAC.1